MIESKIKTQQGRDIDEVAYRVKKVTRLIIEPRLSYVGVETRSNIEEPGERSQKLIHGIEKFSAHEVEHGNA